MGVRYGLAFTVSAGIGVLLAIATASYWRRVADEAYIVRARSIMMTLVVLLLLALPFATSPMQAHLLAELLFLVVIGGTAYSPTMLQNLFPPMLAREWAPLS